MLRAPARNGISDDSPAFCHLGTQCRALRTLIHRKVERSGPISFNYDSRDYGDRSRVQRSKGHGRAQHLAERTRLAHLVASDLTRPDP